MTSTVYMMKKFALSDELLKNTSVVDVAKRQTGFGQLQYFLGRYPVRVEVSGGDLDGIQVEFIIYHVDEVVRTQERADDTWNTIGTHADANGVLQYEALSCVMMGVLTVCERLFSLVTKNKTTFRPTMGVKTLESFTTHKKWLWVVNLVSSVSPMIKLIKNAMRVNKEKLTSHKA